MPSFVTGEMLETGIVAVSPLRASTQPHHVALLKNGPRAGHFLLIISVDVFPQTTNQFIVPTIPAIVTIM